MKRVIVQEFATVDGFVAGPGDSVDFIGASVGGDPTFGRNQLDFIASTDTMLLGRVTYGMFAAYWPNVTEGDDKEFAGHLNAMRKIVFSASLDRAPWGDFPEAEIVRTSAADKIAALKKEPGPNMVVWGSITLAQSLAREGLVDEYQLIICPVALGSGRTLFREHAGLTLLKSRTFDSGAALLAYAPQS